MRAMRRIESAGENGKIFIKVPKEFGNKVEVTISPVKPEQDEHSDWTEEEWQAFSLYSFVNREDDKNVDWEEFFGAQNGRDTCQGGQPC